MARKFAAATNKLTFSLSMTKEFNSSHPIPAEVPIEWEELMGVPITLGHYNGLSTLELGTVESTNDDKFDMVKKSVKLRSTLSYIVLTEVLASEYTYIDSDLDAL